jgi:hypothetical protein
VPLGLALPIVKDASAIALHKELAKSAAARCIVSGASGRRENISRACHVAEAQRNGRAIKYLSWSSPWEPLCRLSLTMDIREAMRKSHENLQSANLRKVSSECVGSIRVVGIGNAIFRHSIDGKRLDHYSPYSVNSSTVCFARMYLH